jgi:thioester reductase-like protein
MFSHGTAMSDYVLLTGGTGLLGRYLIRDLTDRGVSLALLVRPTRKMSAEQRVEALMATWDAQLGRTLPRPHVIQGDLSRPDLGLDAEDRGWIAENCDLVLHNAASLTFHGTDRSGEPWRSNVDGTRAVLDLCRTTGIVDFHQVSTAYVCGLRTDRVLETQLDVGQEPGNDYERSKMAAEQLVREAAFLSPPTVYRPSIIVGDSQNGFSTTFHGFYAALHLAHTLWQAAAAQPHRLTETDQAPTRLTLDGQERKNFVTVDWVSRAISEILVRPECHGKTFHLTSPNPVTSQVMSDVLEQVIDGCNNCFVGPGPLKDPSNIEKLFYEQMQVYSSYWRDDPDFDTSNTRDALPELPATTVDHDMLVKLSEAAVAMGFRWRDRQLVSPEPAAS